VLKYIPANTTFIGRVCKDARLFGLPDAAPRSPRPAPLLRLGPPTPEQVRCRRYRLGRSASRAMASITAGEGDAGGWSEDHGASQPLFGKRVSALGEQHVGGDAGEQGRRASAAGEAPQFSRDSQSCGEPPREQRLAKPSKRPKRVCADVFPATPSSRLPRIEKIPSMRFSGMAESIGPIWSPYQNPADLRAGRRLPLVGPRASLQGRDGRIAPYPWSTMSSGRLFSIGLIASIARLRFTGVVGITRAAFPAGQNRTFLFCRG
jgi:hypothetical protein